MVSSNTTEASSVSAKLLGKVENLDSFADRFEQQRDRLRHLIRRRVHHLLLRRIDLDDVLQEVFLAARQRLKQWNDGAPVSFFVWLRSITVQTIQNLHRFHFVAQRRTLLEERTCSSTSSAGCDPADQAVAPITSPSECAVRRESLAVMHQMLLEMPEEDREIIGLRVFEELPNSEVAELLGISVKAASIRYVRAIGRLRRKMESASGDQSDAN